jgi:hypothetical protein
VYSTSIIILAGLFAALLVCLLVGIIFPKWAYYNNLGSWFVVGVVVTVLYAGVLSVWQLTVLSATMKSILVVLS